MHRFLFCLSYNVLTYLNINTVARVLIVHRKFLGHTQVCPDRSHDQTGLGSFQWTLGYLTTLDMGLDMGLGLPPSAFP